jgi:hypothetical protein
LESVEATDMVVRVEALCTARAGSLPGQRVPVRT